jgi:hypothetical protein
MLLMISNPPPEVIEPGDPRGVPWTFTTERWQEGSYLWQTLNRRIVLSSLFAQASGKGFLRELIAGIERSGLRVAVPTPFAQMQQILEHYGFVPHLEEDADVWELLHV